MRQTTKMILNGASKRILLEGVFSDIQIELSEELEALEDKVTRYGDFEIGNNINPHFSEIKLDFEKFITNLDKYQLQAGQFVENYLKENPNTSWLEMCNLLREKFL